MPTTTRSRIPGRFAAIERKRPIARVLSRVVLPALLVFLFNGLASGPVAQGGAIEAENVITATEKGKPERVEVGRWSQDERGRTRYDFDQWTHIVDPVAQVEWRANSKRGYYSTHELSLAQARKAVDGLKQVDTLGIEPLTTTNLGTREIDGVKCSGALHASESSGRGITLHLELEDWFTEDFGFPLRVKREFRLRGGDGEQSTELRNIVPIADDEWEARFRPNEDWKEVDGEVKRINTTRMGFFDKVAKNGATTRIGRRTDRPPQSRDPFEQGRLGPP